MERAVTSQDPARLGAAARPCGGRCGAVPRRWLWLAALLLFAVYAGVPLPQASGDTVSHVLAAGSILHGEWTRFAPEVLQVPAWPQPPRVFFVETVAGEWASGYGLGVPLALLGPMAALRGLGAGEATLLSDGCNHLVAAAWATLAALLFFLAVGDLVSLPSRLFATAAFALGSPLLSLLSREVWQQSLLALLYAAVLWLLLRRAPAAPASALLGAGFLAGWAVAARPTAALYALPLLWLVARRHGRQAAWFVAPLAGWAAAVAAYNTVLWGRPWVTGQMLIPAREFAPRGHGILTVDYLESLAGLLVSPGVGLLAFSPVLLLAAGLLWRCREERAASPGHGLALAAVAAVGLNLLSAAAYREWWAGSAYGSRYMADTVVFAVLLVGLGLDRALARQGRRRGVIWAAAGVLLALSAALHGAGLLVDPYAPSSYATTHQIDEHPEQLWRHSAALHNLRTWWALRATR